MNSITDKSNLTYIGLDEAAQHELTYEQVFYQSFDYFIDVAHGMAKSKGWYEVPVEDGTRIALMHSELSEALEALRKGYDRSNKIPNYTHLEEELADVIIRIMDFAGFKGLDVAGAICEKIKHNATRSHRHGGKAF